MTEIFVGPHAVTETVVDLGEDQGGNQHYYTSQFDTAAVITPEGRIIRRYSLDGTTLEDYMAAVERAGGWKRRSNIVDARGLGDALQEGPA